MPAQTWSSTVDWICVGSSAGGCAAALAGRVAGAALTGYLFRAVLQRGIAVRTACDVESLLVNQGRVVGLTLTHQGAVEPIRATRGVALATSSGDGWRLAMPAGGEVSVGVVRQ